MRLAILLLSAVLCLSAQGSRTMLLGVIDAPNAPTDSPGAGTYGSTQSVTLTDATAQFINYTTDSSTPACPSTGTLYTGAFNITVTTTLKAIGCNGVTGGGVLTSVYTISAGISILHTALHSNTSTATTVTVTITSSTAGNSLIASIWASQSSNLTAFTGCTPTGGTATFTPAATHINATNNSIGAAIYAAPNIGAGVTSVSCTVTAAANTYLSLSVWEVSGLAASSIQDGTGQSADNMSANTAVTCGTQTTSVANDIVMGVFSSSFGSAGATITAGGTGATFTIPANSSQNDGGSGEVGGAEQSIVSSTGSYAPLFTTSSALWSCVSAAFHA